MKKGRRNRFGTQGRDPRSSRVLPLVGVLADLRQGLLAIAVKAGMRVLRALLEEDRERLVGPRYVHLEERKAYRAGTVPGELVLGGRKVHLARPRVRSLDGKELPLPTYEELSRTDPLAEHVLAQMLLGVSTRGYRGGLERVPEEVEVFGVERSSVSRHFVALTQAQVEAFLRRPLGELDLPVLMVDGLEFAGHFIIAVLGIDAEGRKHVLGLREGSTENLELCRSLLADLVDRGLAAERWRLVVIDGSKALARAVREVFGKSALIHRCHVHKIRNVLGHLPEGKQRLVRSAMQEAYRCGDAALARRKLLALAARLRPDHPGAAASLREGLEETLTVLVLGLPEMLARSLATTNPIESLFSVVRHVSRNVKRWRNGSMVLRWAAVGAIEAGKRFRRLKGFRHMAALLEALRRRAALEKAA